MKIDSLGLPMFTKEQEYKRSIELFEEIYKKQGLYFAFSLLYDMQYTHEDIGKMTKILMPENSINILGEDKITNKQLILNGKTFYCVCGGTVFSQSVASDIYTCQGCNREYVGKRETKIEASEKN